MKEILFICPMELKMANSFVELHHRHHDPVIGCKFCIGLSDGENLRGVLIAGRPVARKLDDSRTIEVNRCCTDGVRNGCSMLYSAARRVAKFLGYQKIITYTLPEEGGSSLKASGWIFDGEAGGGSWTRNGRPRKNTHPLGKKWLWICLLNNDPPFDWKRSFKITKRKGFLDL